jgi:CRISPR-associated protein Cmr3
VWQGRSGQRQAGPKPTRYAAAAGSVYFFEVTEGGPLSVERLRNLWLRPISDQDQDRRDGFGLVLPGVW